MPLYRRLIDSGSSVYGQQVILSSDGDGNFIVPPDVNFISIVLVGRGGAATSGQDGTPGGGGALAYKNNISVNPGQSIPYSFATHTTMTFPGFTITAEKGDDGIDNGAAGDGGSPAGTYDGGGDGGDGGQHTGGGAGGYSGDGGGFNNGSGGGLISATGGGGQYGDESEAPPRNGGGVGLLGEGPSGVLPGGFGSGGSGLAFGDFDTNYGGGASISGGNVANGFVGLGAIRAIWGDGRAFPSTNTQDY